MENPVLVIGFNRPQRVRACLNNLQATGARQVFVHLDGPRINKVDDLYKTLEVEKVVNSFSDKFETLVINKQERNLGCRNGVINAITWFFSKNSQGLIIEDDILISKNFAEFSEVALNHYKFSTRIWHINGWSPNNKSVISNSAFETRFAIPWGWATWADRWNAVVEELDFATQVPPSRMKTNLSQELPENFDDYWSRNFDLADKRVVQGWDYQWIRAMWLGGGLAISPPFRMTTNVGFDSSATHTFRPNRNQIPTYVVKGKWDLGGAKFAGTSDLLFGELTFGKDLVGSVLVSNFKRRYAANRENSEKGKIQVFLQTLSFREIVFQYFSLQGIKCTLLVIFHILKKTMMFGRQS